MVLYKLTRREMAAYYLLLSAGPRINLGDAVDLLARRMCMTKRTARNVVKRLRKLGIARVISIGDELIVELRSPLELMGEDSDRYIAERRRKCWALAKRTAEE